MFLTQHEYYHVYNRGNNKQPIFFKTDNYLLFIKKMREQIKPVADIIAYSLMPNHFHLIVHANEHSIKERDSFGGKPMQEFAFRMGILQSSYAQAINKQNNTTGSLFQQKTKAIMLSEKSDSGRISYLETCFFYCHNNPREAGLVKHLEDWRWSSYLDYVEMRNGTLCNKELFFNETGLNATAIRGWGDWDLPPDQVEKFF